MESQQQAAIKPLKKNNFSVDFIMSNASNRSKEIPVKHKFSNEFQDDQNDQSCNKIKKQKLIQKETNSNGAKKQSNKNLSDDENNLNESSHDDEANSSENISSHSEISPCLSNNLAAYSQFGQDFLRSNPAFSQLIENSTSYMNQSYMKMAPIGLLQTVPNTNYQIQASNSSPLSSLSTSSTNLAANSNSNSLNSSAQSSVNLNNIPQLQNSQSNMQLSLQLPPLGVGISNDDQEQQHSSKSQSKNSSLNQSGMLPSWPWIPNTLPDTNTINAAR